MKSKLLSTVLFLSLSIVGFAKSDIETIKERIVQEILKSQVDDAEIAQILETQKPDGTWPGIDYQNVSREGFEHRFHLANMVELGTAFRTKSSKYFKNKKVLAAVNLALKNWVEHDYICDNWWHNQIGTPRELVTLMMLVGDKLDPELVEKAQPIIGRAHSEAPGARPGGDRIKICGIQAKNCLYTGDYEKFNEVVRLIEAEIKYSEWIGTKYGYGFRSTPGGFENREMGGRGIQYDHSFHHRVDGVNNTLSYGLSYAEAFAEWAVYVAGTQYRFSQEKLAQLTDYFLDGICKMAVFGKYPDMGAKNRSISREGALKPYGPELAEKLFLTTDYRKSELQEIIDIRKNGAKPTLSHATYFWDTEHFSFQRPDWFASVRMYSTRNYNMEQPYNSEGFLNHHRGDGVNHISVTGDEYFDIAPVYDYQKIPGTTIMQKPEMPPAGELQQLGLTSFVGAATDGKYGAAAFDFRSPHDPLIGRKAWFFFDDEYVCLGAGISCKNRELPVFTTLNQCLLRGDVVISSAGKKSILEKGEKEFENIDWIYHDKVGYVFPEPESVNIKNAEASGSWWRINHQTDSPKDEITLDVFSAWLDHGKRPSDATYSYIVVPATSVEKLESNETKKRISILSNTPEVQAVKNSELNIVQAVFYQSGEIQLSEKISLISENPGIILVKMKGDLISEITVSDPNRELLKYHLSVNKKIQNRGENFMAEWKEKVGKSYISIDLPQHHFAGSSVTIRL